MIYLIGGPARVGKSTMARLIQERTGISSISTDALTRMLNTNKQAPIVTGSNDSEWAASFLPYLSYFLKWLQFDYPDFVIEGTGISPQTVHDLSKKYKTKAIFLGNSNITPNQLSDNKGNNLWIAQSDENELEKIALDIQRKSKALAGECGQLHCNYIDLAGDFKSQIEKAYSVLLS